MARAPQVRLSTSIVEFVFLLLFALGTLAAVICALIVAEVDSLTKEGVRGNLSTATKTFSCGQTLTLIPAISSVQ
jgi:hypothetical protein